MLRIVYVCKQNNTFDSEQFIEDKTYEEVLKIAKEYNDDLDNDYYISLVTNYASDPRHTTGFTFKIRKTSFKVRLPNKYNVIGSNAFTCDYLIPWEEK